MSWVKIDDGAYQHPKLLDAGAKAVCLWLCGLSYCNRQERRDGVIPQAVIKLLYPGLGPKEAERLVDVGLWERTERGFRIHDYHQYQPSKAISDIRSMVGKQGGIKSGEARRSKREAIGSSNREPPNEPPSRSPPVPAHPDPTPPADLTPATVASEPKQEAEPNDPGRESVCPLDLYQKAESLGIHAELAEKLVAPIESLRAETRDFVGYWTIGAGAGTRRTGWMRALRERLRKRHGEGQLKPPGLLEHESNGRKKLTGEPVVAPSPYLAEAQRMVAERGRQ